jgi:O-methyltransferase
MLMLFDPVCYSVNSTAMGDVLAAVPVVKYAIDTYHKECDYRVIASKHFRCLFPFVPDSKFLVMEDDTWKFDKTYAVRRLNDVEPKGGNLCRLTPARMMLSHYASIGLVGEILPKSQYAYVPLNEVDVSKFGVDFSKAVVLVVSYRDINRSIPNEELLKIAEYVHVRGYTPIYIGKTDKGAWKDRPPVSPFTPPPYGVDLRNQTTIPELASIMSKSIAVIGVDSGPVHLAGTTATTIIASYTNVDWRYRIPARAHGRTVVIEPDPMDCRYCSSRWAKDTYNFLNCYYGHNNCVKSLRAEKYINALKSVLGEEPSVRLSFTKAWDSIKPSLLGHDKSKNLYSEMCMASGVGGDFAEIGVFKGSTSKMMRLVFPKRKLHCYDTFCGIAGADASVDQHKDGEFAASLEEVRATVGEDGVEYHVGKFPDSYLAEDKKPELAFVHVDLDTYAGTKAALDYLFPRLPLGGTILFDDYRWPNCTGVEKAIKEWLEEHRNECFVREYRYQCAITKKEVG